ncbi:alpha/beta hydrolase [Aspergillus homomorphus CBS 101889]|uniref:AB hydrolase-1 domain-containing protein n=1 Tax=Aspergillus homomorphus (strain CBS 101889) TaxID=1450537 RepID=A0A395HP29_ASPHC|nr:hypothetical protein BO97DRAFT_472430 [Aspergillus homomorphus CBS 101889]RAL09366.1 hypothetical protein BO97DRAFT_472430 [Aspergillus homomorphus CBS 101889]
MLFVLLVVPTIPLEQGSFQTPLAYEKLTTGLRDAGYAVVHPLLPTCSDLETSAFPSHTLRNDAEVVTRVIQQLVEEEGRYVVVVMHSYGGTVGSEAISDPLTAAVRHADGQKGGVLRLFYYAAFALAEGQSVLGSFGESPNNDVLPDGTFRIKNGAQTLYSDLPPQEVAVWDQASSRNRMGCGRRPPPGRPISYNYLPSTYLVCDADQAVPPQFQEGFAALVKAVEVGHCGASHSPMLSQPAMLVGKITAVVDKAAAAVGLL